MAADHTTAPATSVNEHEVRAAAGMTMVIGAVAFAYDREALELTVMARQSDRPAPLDDAVRTRA